LKDSFSSLNTKRKKGIARLEILSILKSINSKILQILKKKELLKLPISKISKRVSLGKLEILDILNN
jgi:hypothetical protein